MVYCLTKLLFFISHNHIVIYVYLNSLVTCRGSKVVLSGSVGDFLASTRYFLLYFQIKFLLIFFAKNKNPYPFTNIHSLGSIK